LSPCQEIAVSQILREHAEQQYAEELRALARADTRPRPPNWKLSPWAVATYVLGGTLDDGFVVEPKYIGSRRLVEIAIATLATDRGLLLLGLPGTAKSWLSEHLAAAISGDSTLLVQGTAGTSEEALRYGWNYARPPAPARRRCATAGTTPACWPRDPRPRRWSPARSCWPCARARSPASRS
jgi:hypothetical protein